MTPEERFDNIEKKLVQINDTLLVAATLQDRLENTVAELTSDVRAHEAAYSRLADGQLVLQAALKSLMAAVERFVQGKGGNGQQPGEEVS